MIEKRDCWVCGECGFAWLVRNEEPPSHCASSKCRSRVWNGIDGFSVYCSDCDNRYKRLSSEDVCPKCKSNRWDLEHKAQRRAHAEVAKAIKNGVLVRQPCDVCGSDKRIEAHHDDYTQPLKVRWLCRKHHAAEYVISGPGKRPEPEPEIEPEIEDPFAEPEKPKAKIVRSKSCPECFAMNGQHQKSCSKKRK